MTDAEVELTKEDKVGDEEPSMAKMKPRIEKFVRARFANRRLGGGVAPYIVAALEVVLGEVVASSEKSRASRRRPKRAIDRAALVTGVRKDAALARAFRQYVFQPSASVKYDGDTLLTKADRAAAQQKRAQVAADKGAKRLVPGVLEG
jgi:hypothetical protein